MSLAPPEITWRPEQAHPRDILAADGPDAAIAEGFRQANAYREIARALLAALHRASRERDQARRRSRELAHELRDRHARRRATASEAA